MAGWEGSALMACPFEEWGSAGTGVVSGPHATPVHPASSLLQTAAGEGQGGSVPPRQNKAGCSPCHGFPGNKRGMWVRGCCSTTLSEGALGKAQCKRVGWREGGGQVGLRRRRAGQLPARPAPCHHPCQAVVTRMARLRRGSGVRYWSFKRRVPVSSGITWHEEQRGMEALHGYAFHDHKPG